MLADVIRVANHGDKNQYDRFMSSLKPTLPNGSERPSLPPATDGFVYEKE
jgi:hypothetical protein